MADLTLLYEVRHGRGRGDWARYWAISRTDAIRKYKAWAKRAGRLSGSGKSRVTAKPVTDVFMAHGDWRTGG